MANLVEPHNLSDIKRSAFEFREDDRVVVTGATGWFGLTLLDLLGSLENPPRILPLASRPRKISTRLRTWTLHTWQVDMLERFEPTVVFNFAFLTRDKIALLGKREYEKQNLEILDQFDSLAHMESVRSVITTSSGAVCQGGEDSYSTLKLREEEIAVACRSAKRASVIARAYSVSGRWVTHPWQYAFSSFILEAQSGAIRVRSSLPTWRRYCDVGDYLKVAAAIALRGQSLTLESGGPLIEMRELAEQIRAEVNPKARVEFADLECGEPQVYASDGTSWSDALAHVSFKPMDLRQQIRYVHRHLAMLNQS